VTTPDVQTIASRVNALSSTRTGALSFLPAYDQRLCGQTVKDLEAGVDKLRHKVPKTRFAFKKKQSVAETVAATAAPERASVAIAATAEQSGLALALPSFEASQKKDAYIKISDLGPASLSSSHDVTLSDLDACAVDLLDQDVTAIYARGLKRCVVVAGLVAGSVRMEDCVDCVVAVGCHQFRMERCRSTDVHLHVTSLPVIEESREVRFAAYPMSLNGSFPNQMSHHDDVKDFSWIKATPSPNWSRLDTRGDAIDWAVELEAGRRQGSWTHEMTSHLRNVSET